MSFQNTGEEVTNVFFPRAHIQDEFFVAIIEEK